MGHGRGDAPAPAALSHPGPNGTLANACPTPPRQLKAGEGRYTMSRNALLNRSWSPYALAVGLVLVIFLFRYAIHGLLSDSAVGLLFTISILIPSMLGGLWPGVFATALATPLVYYFLWLRGDFST